MRALWRGEVRAIQIAKRASSYPTVDESVDSLCRFN
jgi:hypothetical protein